MALQAGSHEFLKAAGFKITVRKGNSMRVTNATRMVLERRLELSPSQIEAFDAFQGALEDLFLAKMVLARLQSLCRT